MHLMPLLMHLTMHRPTYQTSIKRRTLLTPPLSICRYAGSSFGDSPFKAPWDGFLPHTMCLLAS